MGKFRYFELSEFIESATAKKKGIANLPTFEQVDHLCELTSAILDPLRHDWGKAVSVSSGFRCPALNTLVGGVADSVHQIGYAADLTAKDMKAFKAFCSDWFSKTKTGFDQVLLERDKKGNEWVHVALYNKMKQQRRQIMILVV